MTTSSLAASDESYDAALAALYSKAHQATTKEAIQAAAARRTCTITDMRTYLDRISLRVPTRLKVVHVTGTKGKGSTACMCECILRDRYGLRTGLFTSPHLVDIRERIRVGGKPVSQRVFADAYWRIRKELEQNSDTNSDLPVLPGYFRMLTLMALYIFSKYEPAIDVVILEVGMGGRYDATNLLDLDVYETVCGVTLLDYDHVRVLGNTLESIAWEKGGIFQVHKGSDKVSPRPSHDNDDVEKSSVGSTTGNRIFFALDTNTDSSLQVLRQCAATEGEGAQLRLVGSQTPTLPADCVVGLPGPHQRINAEMAIALCEALMVSSQNKNASKKDRDRMYQALSRVSWPGRCQTVQRHNNMTLRLDGAHTLHSMQAGYDWFQSVVATASSAPCVLLFNCSHERNPVELLEVLVRHSFSTVLFCRADSERPSAIGKQSYQELLEKSGRTVQDDLVASINAMPSWQETLAVVWKHLVREDDLPTVDVAFDLTAAEAMGRLTATATKEPVEIFVTGSLYLVGSVLNAIDWSEPEAEGSLQS